MEHEALPERYLKAHNGLNRGQRRERAKLLKEAARQREIKERRERK